MQLEGSLEAEQEHQNVTAQTTLVTGWQSAWIRVKSEFSQARMHLNLQHNRLLWLLLIGDIIFITLYVVHRGDFYFFHSSYLYFRDPRFSLTTEWGPSEIYQYFKEFGSAILLVGIGMRNKQKGFFVWAVLFFYLFLDDSLRIHETLGAVITRLWSLRPIPGIESDGLGQASVSALIGTPLVLGIAFTYFRGNTPFRAFCWQMAFVIAALAFCGVGLDMINIDHQAVWLKGLATIFEDGGEMVILSVALTIVITWYRHKAEADKMTR